MDLMAAVLCVEEKSPSTFVFSRLQLGASHKVGIILVFYIGIILFAAGLERLRWQALSCRGKVRYKDPSRRGIVKDPSRRGNW